MNQFESVKAAVNLRQAAETYGLRVLPNSMTCCPFHKDRHPSLKLNEDYFYCFGCRASGDVIDFTARLFGISPKDAAEKIAADFGINPRPPAQSDIPNCHAEPSRDRERLCISVLREYLRHLRIWQLRCRPEKPGDKFHPRFAEAMKALPTVNHLLDCLLGNDLLLAEKTAEVLCREGHIQRLSSTHYVKSIITAETPMDLERKKEQSFQGDMYVRFMAFSNGDLEALYDKSEGFFRRQLILQTKRKPPGRVDDPFLSDKLKQEVEGIFLWCLDGLKRLQSNNYRFTMSQRAAENREHAKRNANNLVEFMQSEGYIQMKADSTITSRDLYAIYQMWCEDNGYRPIAQRSVSSYLKSHLEDYNLEASNKITNKSGKKVNGFWGIQALTSPIIL